MFGYFLLSVFMILTGFALFGEHSQYAIFAPFRYVVEFFYWTGGNSIDIHSWHRLGMWLIAAFIVGHVYLAIREDIYVRRYGDLHHDQWLPQPQIPQTARQGDLMNAQRVVVMGLGNLLWADEGFGIRVAERLYARYHWPEEVDIVDGGTQGLNLLGYVGASQPSPAP
ncbi:Ni/Fe-hydrogenase 1 b-type cytochrome subunit [Salmonella enterica subsp. arizonae]|uniref:Ni/Fe-hydrogenase 1 b-type cytochrome subunit n=1 Tax=Salmonella enterica subsp. arizonae TaxID=59203 RepID=A0A379SUE4_SALER|nr:Ni/Fe-hydrogenase 1 b-type cytochrome subunit [Salmonella enterica subsp. arizonae]